VIEVRDFSVDITDAQIKDLRERLARARLPEAETVDDRAETQGRERVEGVVAAGAYPLVRRGRVVGERDRGEARLLGGAREPRDGEPHRSPPQADEIGAYYICISARCQEDSALPIATTFGLTAPLWASAIGVATALLVTISAPRHATTASRAGGGWG
jgi:hypothetical protein